MEKNAGSDASDRLFGLPALTIKIEVLQDAIEHKSLTELTRVTECQTYRWLLTTEASLNLDTLAKRALPVVLAAQASEKNSETTAMDMMVAAHHTAEMKKRGKKTSLAAATATPSSKKQRK